MSWETLSPVPVHTLIIGVLFRIAHRRKFQISLRNVVHCERHYVVRIIGATDVGNIVVETKHIQSDSLVRVLRWCGERHYPADTCVHPTQGWFSGCTWTAGSTRSVNINACVVHCCTTVLVSRRSSHRKKLRPIEEAFSFERFHYDAITDTELEAKSQVLVIGQYSTGKTTVRLLLLIVGFDYFFVWVGAGGISNIAMVECGRRLPCFCVFVSTMP